MSLHVAIKRNILYKQTVTQLFTQRLSEICMYWFNLCLDRYVHDDKVTIFICCVFIFKSSMVSGQGKEFFFVKGK
jgi:hypothetical protein